MQTKQKKVVSIEDLQRISSKKNRQPIKIEFELDPASAAGQSFDLARRYYGVEANNAGVIAKSMLCHWLLKKFEFPILAIGRNAENIWE